MASIGGKIEDVNEVRATSHAVPFVGPSTRVMHGRLITLQLKDTTDTTFRTTCRLHLPCNMSVYPWRHHLCGARIYRER